MKNFLKRKTKKGFNMIEIIITVTVISILSTVIVVSVSKARLKGQDTAIIASANGIMQAAQADVRGSRKFDNWYTGEMGAGIAFGGFFTSDSDCDNPAYFVNAKDPQNLRDLCKNIIKNVDTPTSFFSGSYGATKQLFMGSWGGGFQKFVVTAYLPGKKKVYCIGSSGKSSSDNNPDGSGCGGGEYSWICPGCTGDLQGINGN